MAGSGTAMMSGSSAGSKCSGMVRAAIARFPTSRDNRRCESCDRTQAGSPRKEKRLKRAGSDDTLRCSFCHKSQDVVGKLISSPSDYPRAYICDECIAVCNSILEDDKPEPTTTG